MECIVSGLPYCSFLSCHPTALTRRLPPPPRPFSSARPTCLAMISFRHSPPSPPEKALRCAMKISVNRLFRLPKCRFREFRYIRKAIVCSSGGSNGSPTRPDISSAAKIRSEVISPFRTVRMFFYLAFIASGSIGGLVSLPRLIAAFGHGPNAQPIQDILKGLGIDLAAIFIFALLYRLDAKARDQQLAKLSREETLAALKLELSNKKVVTVGQMRGAARLVIVAGSASHIEEAYRGSESFVSELIERGVLVVPLATNGLVPILQPGVSSSEKVEAEGSSSLVNLAQAEKLWRAIPVYTTEWTRWLREQKQLANVPDDKPVYLSLRMDGRVRGSGVGYPPWGAFVSQLPPLKGIWAGALDGMDGRI